METAVALSRFLFLLVVAVGAILLGYIAEEETIGRRHEALEDWGAAEAGMPVPA